MYPVRYNVFMLTVKETDIFKNWMQSLKDKAARSIINARIKRLSHGHKGGTKYLHSGVSELKIDFGPGYRVYFTYLEKTVVILLCGGDKSTQSGDITKAKTIAESLENENEKS